MRLFRRLRTESRPDLPSGISSNSNDSLTRSARSSFDFRSLRSSSAQSSRPSLSHDDEILDDEDEDTVEVINTPQPSSSSGSICGSLREQMQPTLRRHGTVADISALLLDHQERPPLPPPHTEVRRDEASSPRNAINLERPEPRRNALTLERSQTDLREKFEPRRATPPPTAAIAAPFVPRQRSTGRFTTRSRPSTADGPSPRSPTAASAAATPSTTSAFAAITPSKLRLATSSTTRLGQPQTPAEKCRSESEERDTASVITHILPPPFGFSEDAFEERVDLIKGLVSCYTIPDSNASASSLTSTKNRRLSPSAATRQIVERVEMRTERMLIELLAIDRLDKALVTQVRLPLVFALVRQQCGLDPASSLFKSFEPEADATTLATLSAVVYPGFGLIRTVSEVIAPRRDVVSGLVFFGNEPEPNMPSLSPPPRPRTEKKRRPTTAPTTPVRPEFGATISAPSSAPAKRMTMAVPPPRRSSKRYTTVAPLSFVPSPRDILESTTTREELPWTPVTLVNPSSLRHPYAANDAISSAYPDTPTTPTMPLSRQPAVSLLASSPTRAGSSRRGSASPETPSLQMGEGSEGGWDSSARPSFSTSNSASGSPVAPAVSAFGPSKEGYAAAGLPRLVTHGSLL